MYGNYASIIQLNDTTSKSYHFYFYDIYIYELNEIQNYVSVFKITHKYLCTNKTKYY